MLAALLVSVASTRTWIQRAGIGLTGADITGGLITATALMLVITAALLLVVKTVGRRVTGIVQALVGAGIVAVVLTHRTASARQWAAKGVDPGAAQMTVTPWPWVCLAAGALTMVTGCGLAVLADRWPSRSARRDGDLVGDSRSAWDALDRGEDPTLADSQTRREAPSPAQPEPAELEPSTSRCDESAHMDGNGSPHRRQARTDGQSG
ncbi:Trp biosynthesis-associated membrane protein [Cutibacterium equinum]|uniref:Trp biosynthesis-associated membrane protein n=1 Tax=Cutibacterium equinum TaxID=3016342 RepID=A0ABY7R1E2_9ACTN|nr:Trp biosynthesis-associated membrane protein [Cutibacterium equinum]WCC81082.1 Trp biosynthesis-associated membrane protein [Cutibacterium equinum]